MLLEICVFTYNCFFTRGNFIQTLHGKADDIYERRNFANQPFKFGDLEMEMEYLMNNTYYILVIIVIFYILCLDVYLQLYYEYQLCKWSYSFLLMILSLKLFGRPNAMIRLSYYGFIISVFLINALNLSDFARGLSAKLYELTVEQI